MGFRDELEAARARIEALDQDVAQLRREKVAAKVEAPPFAMLSVVLLVIGVGLAVGIAFEWDRGERAAAEARRWRQLEGETAVQLQETRVRLDEARRGVATTAPSGTRDDAERVWAWERDGEASESWTGRVTERFGDAPAGLGQTCTTTVIRAQRQHVPHHFSECTVHVRCGERDVYPASGEASGIDCTLSSSHIAMLAPLAPTTRRLTGYAGDLRVDDGPVGTWAVRIEAVPR